MKKQEPKVGDTVTFEYFDDQQLLVKSITFPDGVCYSYQRTVKTEDTGVDDPAPYMAELVAKDQAGNIIGRQWAPIYAGTV